MRNRRQSEFETACGRERNGPCQAANSPARVQRSLLRALSREADHADTSTRDRSGTALSRPDMCMWHVIHRNSLKTFTSHTHSQTICASLLWSGRAGRSSTVPWCAPTKTTLYKQRNENEGDEISRNNHNDQNKELETCEYELLEGVVRRGDAGKGSQTTRAKMFSNESLRK